MEQNHLWLVESIETEGTPREYMRGFLSIYAWSSDDAAGVRSTGRAMPFD